MAIDPVYRTPHGLTPELRENLLTQGNVVLATISDDGSPHLTELLFDIDSQDRILMPTPHNTRKVKNLRQRPVATLFFYDQPGWASCYGDVEIIEGEQAVELNRLNRERLLTESGHNTIGLVLARHEDLTLRLTPKKWLSWSGGSLVPAIIELGGDVEANPPETWFKDLKAHQSPNH